MRPASLSPAVGGAPAGRRGDGRRQSPTIVYQAALSSADSRLWVHLPDGRRMRLPVQVWRGALSPGDGALLRRCTGPVLDVGCGPGRLAAALAARGALAMGIDVAPVAVLLARRAGATALCRDVFDPLPGEGRWSTLLLADGNIGIGGDPGRLLTRAAELLDRRGRVLVELDPRPCAAGPQLVRLEGPGGDVSTSFRWSFVGPTEIADHARTAGLTLVDEWRGGGRHFVALGSAR
jgi:SAM-dependent methyltransferase